MATESTQLFHGRTAKIGDEAVVMVAGTLYPGEITSIDDALDLPYLVYDWGAASGGPFAYYDGEDKNLAPNDTFMWHVRGE